MVETQILMIQRIFRHVRNVVIYWTGYEQNNPHHP